LAVANLRLAPTSSASISVRLDALVEALLQTETLDAADAYRAAGVPYPAEPDLPAPDVVHH
jgi:hypothetical protein